MTIWLDGDNLTIEQVIQVAFGEPGNPRLQLTQAARKNVQRASDAVEKMVQDGRIAYGITTGFGAFKDRLIPREDARHCSVISWSAMQ